MEQALNGLMSENIYGAQFVRRAMCIISTFLPPEQRTKKTLLEYAMKYTNRPEIQKAYEAAIADYEETEIAAYVNAWS